MAIHLRGTRLTQSGLPGITLTTPQIEGVTEGQIEVAHSVIAPTLPAWVLGARQTRARDIGIRIERWHAICIGCAGRRKRLMRPRTGHLHIRAVAQSFLDQAIELRITELFPPVALRPGGWRGIKSTQRLPGLQVFGLKAHTFSV